MYIFRLYHTYMRHTCKCTFTDCTTHLFTYIQMSNVHLQIVPHIYLHTYKCQMYIYRLYHTFINIHTNVHLQTVQHLNIQVYNLHFFASFVKAWFLFTMRYMFPLFTLLLYFIPYHFRRSTHLQNQYCFPLIFFFFSALFLCI